MDYFRATLIFALFGVPTLGLAETESNESTDAVRSVISVDEIALELSNPVTTLRSLAWDIEYTTFRGDLPGSEDQTGLKNIFTPSWPIKLENGKNLLLSATIPLHSDQPTWKFNGHHAEFRIRQAEDIGADQGRFFKGHDHLNDLGFNFAYGGASENGFISMYGLAVVVPTSEDHSAARGHWLLGPEIALGRVTSWGLVGARAKHLTSVTESDKGLDTNETTVKVFFAYALGNGWQIESNPVILYDWEAVPGNEWTVPVGAAISRTINLKRFPMKLAFDIQKYVVTPDRFGPDWQFTLNLTPVFSSKLLR